jgi:WD40 repeat protein
VGLALDVAAGLLPADAVRAPVPQSVRRVGHARDAGSPRALAGAGDKIHALAFDPSGTRVVAAIGGQWGRLEHAAVRSWTVADGRPAAAASDHAVTVDAIAIAKDGATIGTASRDGIVRNRDATDFTTRHELTAHERGVPVLAFVDDGTTFVSGSEDGEVAWWGVDGRAIARAPAGVGPIADAAWTSAGLVVDGESGLARMSEGNATPLGELTGVTAIAALPDGTIVVGHGDGTLSRIELATATTQWSAATFGRSVTDVAVSPDGTRIAISSQDYRVRLHDAASGEYLLTVGAHESVATAVAFSPDGKSIASGGYDRVVRLWHAPTAD